MRVAEPERDAAGGVSRRVEHLEFALADGNRLATLEFRHVLEVVATDSGSVSDVQGWADGTDGVELLEQIEGDGLYTHYVKKTE